MTELWDKICDDSIERLNKKVLFKVDMTPYLYFGRGRSLQWKVYFLDNTDIKLTNITHNDSGYDVLFDKKNPTSPINRRISIIVMNKSTVDSIIENEGKVGPEHITPAPVKH